MSGPSDDREQFVDLLLVAKVVDGSRSPSQPDVNAQDVSGVTAREDSLVGMIVADV